MNSILLRFNNFFIVLENLSQHLFVDAMDNTSNTNITAGGPDVEIM